VGAFDLEKLLEIDPFFLGEVKQPKVRLQIIVEVESLRFA